MGHRAIIMQDLVVALRRARFCHGTVRLKSL